MTHHDDMAFAEGLRTAVATDGLRSPLDAHRVLASARRAQRRRRTAALSATAGCAAAVGLLAGPLVARTAPDHVPPAAASGTLGAAGVAELAPGVTAAVDPRVHDRVGGGVVVDLGLPTWEPGTRFFLTVDDAVSDLPLRVWAGDDADLETLLAGAEPAGGPVVASRGSLAVVSSPAGDDQLAVGFDFDQSEAVGDPVPEPVASLVMRETFRAADGSARATIDVPTSPVVVGPFAAAFAVRIADAGTDLGPPAVRGVFLRYEASNGYSYGGCDPDPAECMTVWDPAGGTRAAETRSSEPSADDVSIRAFAEDYLATDPWASPGGLVAACRDERRELDATRGLAREDEDLRWQCEADGKVDSLRGEDGARP
ncbi:hypothetical protein [Cellulosimicrobium cellulans]|uniref:hypothetical protein n=1 Tax=Cellulosimicrobium cellulans TaxID=1710 RepID=UPI001BA55A1F|nr:hypothetical protein [Cellulosimicrobium cellulans]QUB99342.1 hypothetical protein J5A69_16805 [Cellulosimicrobium cellulans]